MDIKRRLLVIVISEILRKRRKEWLKCLNNIEREKILVETSNQVCEEFRIYTERNKK